MTATVFTIGHSDHTIAHFQSLLRQHGISALADVRSVPRSRHGPQFNQHELMATLRNVGIRCALLGREMGGRSDNPDCYCNKQVQYDPFARTKSFQNGLGRIAIGCRKYRLVLMCSEQEPNTCHRSMLVSRSLVSLGYEVRHILPTGEAETHDQSIQRLISSLDLDNGPLFADDGDLVERAYATQSRKIAYSTRIRRPGAKSPTQERQSNEDIHHRLHEDNGETLF